MSKHNNNTVYSFPALARIMSVSIKELEKLVKQGELERVTSKVFKIPAITKKSYKDMVLRKKLELEKLYKEQNEEAFSSKEVMVLLDLNGSSSVYNLYMSGKFRKVRPGHYSKKEVLAYKKKKR